MTRTAILSDIHGNLTALEAVLEDVAGQNVDRIVCLGDVIGYGPAPCQCLDRVAQFDFCVLGNHDSSALFDPEGFNVAAEQAIFWTRAQVESGSDGPDASRRRMQMICALPRLVDEGNVLFVHGSPRGPTNEYVFPEDTQNLKKMEKLFSLVPHLCFQGHTHVPGVFTTDLRFVRPVPYGTRTRVAAVKGRCPRPLDEGAVYAKCRGRTLRRPINLNRDGVVTKTTQIRQGFTAPSKSPVDWIGKVTARNRDLHDF